jgi:hypothetical protein
VARDRAALIAEMSGRRAAAFVAAAPGLRVRGTTMESPAGTLPCRSGSRSSVTARRIPRLHARPAREAGWPPRVLPRRHGPVDARPVARGAQARLARPGRPRRGRAPVTARGLRPRDPRLAGRRERLLAPGTGSRRCSSPACQRGSDGMPIVPGTRQFWTAVFPDTKQRLADARRDGQLALLRQRPLTSVAVRAGLHRQPGGRPPSLPRSLFVSRLEARGALGRPRRPSSRHARRTVPGAHLLAGAREARRRGGLRRGGSARGADLSPSGTRHAATRALAQFQGALALVTRAGLPRGIRPGGAGLDDRVAVARRDSTPPATTKGVSCAG